MLITSNYAFWKAILVFDQRIQSINPHSILHNYLNTAKCTDNLIIEFNLYNHGWLHTGHILFTKFCLLKVLVFYYIYFLNNICKDNHIALIPASFLRQKNVVNCTQYVLMNTFVQ